MSSLSRHGLSLQLGDLHQRARPSGGMCLQAVQAVADENAVFIDQRHDVGHGADRGQADGRHQKVPQRLADALGLAGPLAEGPGQLERHARAAQAAERIAVPRQPRMDDRRRVRQSRGELVVIGDDQLQAQLAGQRRFGNAGDAAIDA